MFINRGDGLAGFGIVELDSLRLHFVRENRNPNSPGLPSSLFSSKRC
jgi:hypothetical protein